MKSAYVGGDLTSMAPTSPSLLESRFQLLECSVTRGVAHSEPVQPAGR